ncbi:hypothetical protein TVAG_375680 [Trichomonas vaginalis G3]|uniref:Uncharacterized protein n=1 Tax=Trichomonas vaginalis (strain ATCC PRA-98 / G3) TaxID=412133 RepID=A2FY44_TRIV3|nr:glycosyl hydrolases family 16 [Trichomonas vaginalis G3]EAX90177.1 hypothetical protein TVAG_375680 [Trichomonas vaginalis G3]KAI5505486.1 glycosyl hydrolases family 16 [Trichomonas vaginalis G3]|eukprot:XP_001303107.1 hypothetical protein [Trichomonas vaginalis G3]
MEYYRDRTVANLAWASSNRWQAVWESVSTPVSSDWKRNVENWENLYHLWRMDWDEDSIKLYLDGELCTIVSLSRTINQGQWKLVSNPFKYPHYLIVNLALGADSGGDIDDSAFPIRYCIDYIRIYQQGRYLSN